MIVGTEQILETHGSVTEAENEVGGTIPFRGSGTEGISRFGGSVAERSSRVWWLCRSVPYPPLMDSVCKTEVKC